MLPPKLDSAASTTARMPTFVSAHLRLVAVPTPQIAIKPMEDIVEEPDSKTSPLASAIVATVSITACVAAVSWAVFVSIFP